VGARNSPGWIATAAAVCAVALVPAAASASTTLGEANAADSTVPTCPTDVTVAQTGVAPGGPSFSASTPGGVITSWSYTAASPGDRVQLDLLQPANFAGGYLVVGRTDAMTAAAGPNTFPARLTAHPGDMLGVTDFGSASACWRATAAAQDAVAYCSGCDVFSVPGTLLSTTPRPGTRVNVAAVMEPDADGDGYGDETQDKCLDDPYTGAEPCSADVAVSVSAPPSVTQGGELDYQVTVTNNGPSIAKGTTISDVLPQGVTFIPQHSTSACAGTTTIVCTMPPMSPRTSMPGTFIAVSADQLGSVTSSVSLGHGGTPDPDSSNDQASATTGVTGVVLTPEQQAALFGGVGLADQTLVPSAKRFVKVRASCPAPGSVQCKGTLTLTTKGKVTLPRSKRDIRRHRGAVRKVLRLGSATFSIPLGKSASVSVRLSTTAMSVLTRALSLDAAATAAASDAAAHTRTTSAHVLLVAPDKPKKKAKRKPRRRH
jgi:uncharacterized repeat protein (TIGR01451 family)